MNWNGRGRKWSQPVGSTIATFVWRKREKPMNICHASWYHGQDSHQVLPSQPFPSVVLYNITITRTSALFISQSPSVCPYPSSYYNSLQVSKCNHMHSSSYFHSSSSSKVHLCWCKFSVKSYDGTHIAVKTQSSNTPNGSPQFTQVPLQHWAVFIIPSSYNLSISPLSYTIPTECDFRGQLQYAELLPFGPSRYLQLPAPLWCCVDWHNRFAQMSHIFIILLILSRNFSFIWTAVLPIHYALCQPLLLSRCLEVHQQGVIKLPLEQPSNIELLCLPQGRVPWFWFLAWGWPIHIIMGSTSCVLAAEVMLQMVPYNQGMLLVRSPCPTAFSMHVNHIRNRCFIDVADQQPYWLLHKGDSFNALSLTNMSTIVSTVWTAYNRGLFLNCADVTTSPSLQCQLKFPKKEWSQVWTVQRMQYSHAII